MSHLEPKSNLVQKDSKSTAIESNLTRLQTQIQP